MAENLGNFEELLQRSGISPEDVDQVTRMNVWQGYIKNEQGEIETTDLVGMQFRPKQEEVDVESLLVRQAAPVKITPTRRQKPTRDGESILVGGDAQIPFHDPRAMELFQTVNAEKKPEEVVLIGDMLDLASMSRFQQRPEWVQSTQGSIDYFHTFLAQLRADNPQGKITVVHGNHEQRMDNYLARNAAEVLGLRRANMAHELSVLSLQYLLRYDDLGVNSVDGYPNGVYWPDGSDAIKFIHGTNVKKGGSNAAKYLQEERESTVYGHTHRQELAYRTFATRVGGITIAAASPGALCLTDGSVPGFNHTVNAQGEVVKKAEDWQQGILYIHRDGDTHDIEPVLITPRGIRLEGQTYKA